jgi:hypothetical protein
MVKNTSIGQSGQGISDTELALWLAKRLDKGLSMDTWQRHLLEDLLSKLQQD